MRRQGKRVVSTAVQKRVRTYDIAGRSARGSMPAQAIVEVIVGQNCTPVHTEAVSTYHQDMNRQNQHARAQSEADRQALTKIERGLNGIMAAIENGLYESTMKARMTNLETRKVEITARLNTIAPPLPDVNPNIAEIYRRKVERLADALSDPQARQEASMALRSLIGDIVLTPGPKRGEIQATLRGELMSILEFAADWKASVTFPSRVITNAVACPHTTAN